MITARSLVVRARARTALRSGRGVSGLAHERIQSSSGDNQHLRDHTSSPSSMVFLHGILGSKQNLRSFARKVANSFPETTCYLVDLPAHGDSPNASPVASSATVQFCAEEVARLLVEDLNVRPNVICGHSFGGKVSLALLHNQDINPRACWILDSQPGLVNLKGQHRPRNENSVEYIIDTIAEDIKPPFESKENMMAQMEKAGIDLGIRHWMTTNLARNDDGTLDWKFDIDAVKNLFHDYCSLDMWSSLGTNAARDVDLHIVRATKNSFWARKSTIEHLAEQQAANPDRLFVHDVDAGHWLHAEKPNDLFDVMTVDGKLGDALE